MRRELGEVFPTPEYLTVSEKIAIAYHGGSMPKIDFGPYLEFIDWFEGELCRAGEAGDWARVYSLAREMRGIIRAALEPFETFPAVKGIKFWHLIKWYEQNRDPFKKMRELMREVKARHDTSASIGG